MDSGHRKVSPILVLNDAICYGSFETTYIEKQVPIDMHAYCSYYMNLNRRGFYLNFYL